MVYCTIDDKVAFPSSSDKIKVTYENPFIKDSGSYTYDVTFPMSIQQLNSGTHIKNSVKDC